MKKKSVTYGGIWKIAGDSNLTYKEKKDKLEGLIRKMVTEILNECKRDLSKARRKRKTFEYGLIDIGRAIETIASE